MSRIRNVLTTSAILMGSSVALLTGGIAKADPVLLPAPIPAVPGLNLIQGLMDPAKFPQLLQAASSVLTAAPALAPAPVAAAPLAGAPLYMPQSGTTLPGMTPAALPGMTPAALPVATAPVATPASQLGPLGALNLPQIPGLPAPLSQALAVPGEIASLLPTAPGAAITQPGVTPAAAANSPMPGVGTLFPTSALP